MSSEKIKPGDGVVWIEKQAYKERHQVGDVLKIKSTKDSDQVGFMQFRFRKTVATPQEIVTAKLLGRYFEF